MMINHIVEIPLVQGDCQISDDPFTIFTTILGSCIAVCMFDEIVGVGGMNHFLLPGTEQNNDKNLRYGVHSMELLINGLLKMGAKRSQLRAKIFGGGNISGSNNKIGEINQRFIKEFLRREGMKCQASNLGGRFARKIRFTPVGGTVRHILVPNANIDDEVVASTLRGHPSGAIELFDELSREK